MRSTIFTSLAALCVAAAAPAQESPRHGCYERQYSRAHLARQPDQIAERVVMRVRPDAPGGATTVVDLAVWTARQGHVRKTGLGGQRFDQFLFCWRDGKTSACSVECDGGMMEIERDDGDVLQFGTRYLMVGDTGGCGGLVDMAERPGQPVSYRLTRAPEATCTAVFGGK